MCFTPTPQSQANTSNQTIATPAPVKANPLAIQQLAPAPLPPTPYYAQQAQQQEAKTNAQADQNAARARVGRSALKIDLVNPAGSTSGSGINTTN